MGRSRRRSGSPASTRPRSRRRSSIATCRTERARSGCSSPTTTTPRSARRRASPSRSGEDAPRTRRSRRPRRRGRNARSRRHAAGHGPDGRLLLPPRDGHGPRRPARAVRQRREDRPHGRGHDRPLEDNPLEADRTAETLSRSGTDGPLREARDDLLPLHVPPDADVEMCPGPAAERYVAARSDGEASTKTSAELGRTESDRPSRAHRQVHRSAGLDRGPTAVVRDRWPGQGSRHVERRNAPTVGWFIPARRSGKRTPAHILAG